MGRTEIEEEVTFTLTAVSMASPRTILHRHHERITTNPLGRSPSKQILTLISYSRLCRSLWFPSAKVNASNP